MIARILSLSVRMRWLVAFLTLLIVAIGGWQITKLPIDAVPDVTNRQVQISTFAPTLGPVDIEKQVTFPVETALAGIPGLEMTRSFSRNGFSQVTAVFTDQTNIYFARQQVTERLQQAKDSLPAGIQPNLAPLSTGLGEIFFYSVAPAAKAQGKSTVNPAGSRTAAISPPRANASPPNSPGPLICALCRTGSSGRRCAMSRASPGSIPTAVS